MPVDSTLSLCVYSLDNLDYITRLSATQYLTTMLIDPCLSRDLEGAFFTVGIARTERFLIDRGLAPSEGFFL